MNEPIILALPTEQIKPSPYQSRKHFRADGLADLARSIERDGLIEPVVVRRQGDGWELIAGERRWRAVRDYGSAKEILARVVEADDLQARRMCAAENLQREDLSAIEQVEALVEVVDAELIEDAEYSASGPDARERVTRLLATLDRGYVNSERGSKTARADQITVCKFIDRVCSIFASLPRPMEWRSFYLNDLRLATKIDADVRDVAIANGLNKHQTTELANLKRRDEEAYEALVENRDVNGVVLVDSDALSGPIDGGPVPLADLSGREIERMAQLTMPAPHLPAPPKPTPPLPEGKYSVIYADPPWAYSFSRDSADEIEVRYRTMTIQEIRDLTVDGKSVKDLFADQCALFLWTTATKIPEAVRVMRAWGFRFKSSWMWHKSGLGQGYWSRVDHELILIGTRGDHPCPPPEVRESSVTYAEKTGHSIKPDCFRERIARTFPDARRVELFGRGAAPEGWTFWGNEAE